MELIQSNLLNEIPGLRHGFFCRGLDDGSNDNLSFKNGDQKQVLDARRRACAMLDISHERLTHVYQVHGTAIWTVTADQAGAGALSGEGQIGEGDGMLTNVPNLPLAILVADCLPIFLAHPSENVVGIVHAGWRGTADGIAFKAVEQMVETYGIQAQDLIVWIGPGICRENFEVGDEVLNLFQERWGECSEYIGWEERRIDLKGLNLFHLVSSGVCKQNIDISPACTYADTRFFSYRRDGAGVGHNMAVIQQAGAS